LRAITAVARSLLLAAVALGAVSAPAFAQTKDTEDTRTQYPALLRNAFFTVGVGGVSQPFSQEPLAPGLQATAIDVPPVAARVILFGHEITRFISFQVGYLRPVKYVTYVDVLGPNSGRNHVRVNFGTLTLTARVPIRGRLSAYGEGGLGITSRTGFNVGTAVGMADAHYPSLVAGGGAEYALSPNWALTGGLLYLPGKTSVHQPPTTFVSGNVRYTIRALPEERVEAAARSGYIFHKQIVYLEYSSGFGYGVNTFVSKDVPIFWGGHAEVDFGLAPHYEQNVFHTRKTFALDVGASAGFYRTRHNHDDFYTLSAYPLFRFMFVRSKSADVYAVYSLAGPTYISSILLDGLDTGRHFTFQDFIGVGMFLGRQRNLNVGLKINHYSNGNIFPQNAGIKIPLTFSVGYAF
jgi:opacity protein-like surface antigen